MRLARSHGTRVRKTILTAAIGVLVAGLLSSCGGASKTNPSSTVGAGGNATAIATTGSGAQAPGAVKNDTTGAAQFAKSYYEAWFTSSSDSTYSELSNALNEATKDIDRNKVVQDDPMSVFNAMTEAQQKSIAEKTTQINPMSDYYDTTGMTDAEIAILNVIATGFSSGYHTDQKVTVAVNKDKVTVDGSTGSVPYTALTVTVGDKSNTPTGTDFTLPLIYKDGKWKVDGKKFSAMVISNYSAHQSATATPTP